jgi:hypothetical protein
MSLILNWESALKFLRGVYSENKIVIRRSEGISSLQVDQFSHNLIDYKFFCFNGRTEFLYVMGNRETGSSVSVKLFDRDFNPLSVKRIGDAILENVRKPLNFAELRQVAEKLSEEFQHVRVDLYDENNRIRFGELTFYNASGYMRYEPDEFDYDVGKMFRLPKNRNYEEI